MKTKKLSGFFTKTGSSRGLLTKFCFGKSPLFCWPKTDPLGFVNLTRFPFLTVKKKKKKRPGQAKKLPERKSFLEFENETRKLIAGRLVISEPANSASGMPFFCKPESLSENWEDEWERVQRQRREGHKKFLGGNFRPFSGWRDFQGRKQREEKLLTKTRKDEKEIF